MFSSDELITEEWLMTQILRKNFLNSESFIFQEWLFQNILHVEKQRFLINHVKAPIGIVGGCLVSLFHGVSTVLGYLVLKPSLYKNNKKKLVTVVKGGSKAPFSIATTTKCWGGRYSILPLILTLLCRVLSKIASSSIFESLIWLDLGLNPGLPGHWQTLKVREMIGFTPFSKVNVKA